jgi:hypothetical protein
MTTDDMKNNKKLAALPNVLDAIDSDWDDAGTLEVLTLPSGKRVQVRPISLLSMIANDLLPNELMEAARLSAGIDDGSGGASGDAAAQSAVNAETQARDGVRLIDFMVTEMCVRPRFVNKPPSQCAADERSVHTVWDSDKMWLFSAATRGQAALKSRGDE